MPLVSRADLFRAELNGTLLELERKGQRWMDRPQRYKGPGRNGRGSAADTTMDLRRRALRRFRIEDAAPARGMFGLLMGSEVAPAPGLHRRRRRRTRPGLDRHLTAAICDGTRARPMPREIVTTDHVMTAADSCDGRSCGVISRQSLRRGAAG